MSSAATVMIEMIRELHAALVDAHDIDQGGYCSTCHEIECDDAALIARTRSFLRAADKEMAK